MDRVGGFRDQIFCLDHEFKSDGRGGMSSDADNDLGFELKEDIVKIRIRWEGKRR